MKLMFVIPTTAGPLVITALRPRGGLPVSAAFADGDFRGLPWSGDYARLCSPGGPLSRVIPKLVPHELRLSGSFDAGRSWEAPVALAHLMVAQGHTCAAALVDAEAIVWTTGAVDLDLAPIGGDYAVTDKVERTAALLAEAPDRAPLIAILPPAPDAEASWTRLQAIAGTRAVVRVAAAPMADLAATLMDRIAPASAASPVPRRSMRAWSKAAAAVAMALAAAGGLGTYALNRASSGPQDEFVAPARGQPSVGLDSKLSGNREHEHDAPAPAPAPPVAISEIRAAPGGDCRRVLFVPGAALRQPVQAIDDTTFAPSRLEDALCGIAIRPVTATDRLIVEGELPDAALAPVVGPDGATIYILRANRQQNVVYRIHVSGEMENGRSRATVVGHAIMR